MPSCFRFRVRALAPLILTAVALSACGPKSPAAPTPTPTPTPAPTPTPNAAPVIVSLTSASPRVDADGEVALTAVVQDAETPLDQLTYQWSATPSKGGFIGTGAQVRWRAPRQQTSPDVYSLKLTVTEKYVSGGQPAQNEVSKTVAVHYNDSTAEVTKISMRFLTELFPDFSVSAQAAVQDFSDNCSEKFSELSDVANNRINFHILSGTYTNVAVNLDSSKTSADVTGQCTFVDIPTNPNNPLFGRRESVSGICTLTAIYESWKWYLCSSHFRGTGTVPLNELRFRVPGRIVAPSQ
jgi:hypothetical protein